MRKITCMLLSVLLLIGQGWAQTRKVSGTVTDNLGKPLESVTVTAVGSTNNSTLTDVSGTFSLQVPSSVKAL